MEPKTIDLTPTWSGLLPGLLAVIQNAETVEARLAVEKELRRMARLADAYVEAVNRAGSIIALDGLLPPKVAKLTPADLRAEAATLRDMADKDAAAARSAGYGSDRAISLNKEALRLDRQANEAEGKCGGSGETGLWWADRVKCPVCGRYYPATSEDTYHANVPSHEPKA